MKLDEFKAWFEGFTESMEGRPTDKQWKRIKEQVKKIDGTPVSYPVYIDHYFRPYHRWYDSVTWTAAAQNADLRAYSTAVGSLSGPVHNSQDFDGVTAMYAAGKAEALSGDEIGFIHDNGV